MHHDGMEFFPLDQDPRHGLLAINHEYTDDGLLHADGMKTLERRQGAQVAGGARRERDRGGGARAASGSVMPHSRVRPPHHGQHAHAAQRPGGRP